MTFTPGKTPGILYPYLPEMAECNHCGDCCGPVAVTVREADLIREYVVASRLHWRQADILTCGFYDGSKKACRIYPVRPFGCRLFGVCVQMPCPYYPGAARISFPADQAMKEGWMEHDALLLAAIFGDEPCPTRG